MFVCVCFQTELSPGLKFLSCFTLWSCLTLLPWSSLVPVLLCRRRDSTLPPWLQTQQGSKCLRCVLQGADSKQCRGNQLGKTLPLKGIHWLLCPKHAADAQRCFKTNTRHPVPALEFILLWRKQTWRNPCAAKHGGSGAVDTKLTVNYSCSGPC